MSKYIIEIEEKPLCVFDKDTQTYFPRLWRVKGFNSLVLDKEGLSRLEELNSDYINEHYGELQDEAYKQGYAEAERIWRAPSSDNEFYQKGLGDAWEAARRIVVDTDHGGLALGTLSEIFGTQSYSYIMRENNAQEAIAKIKAYEESKNKICVGDIVYFKGKPEIKACVTAINESGMETTFCGIAITNVETYCSVGNPYSFCRTDDWCKTGERFDIEQLWRGEDNA